jgi:hypothetical protein
LAFLTRVVRHVSSFAVTPRGGWATWAGGQVISFRPTQFEGNRIKLTKKDSGEGNHTGHHHFIDRGLVAGVEGNTVRLSAIGAVAVMMEEEKEALNSSWSSFPHRARQFERPPSQPRSSDRKRPDPDETVSITPGRVVLDQKRAS